MKTPTSRLVLLSILLAAAGCSDQAATQSADQPAAAAAVEVAVVSMHRQAIARAIQLPGRVVALATAEIRPQVDGIVRRIAYTEGGKVMAGDVLYELEPRKFEAALASAQANYRKALASVTGAQATLDRNLRLAETNAVSTQTVEDARTALLEAQAEAEAAKADADTAAINLDNTRLRAPIAGIIGISSVSVGALVTANQTDTLATIRQIDPIHIDLVDSSANLLRIGDEVRAGTLGREKSAPAAVSLTLENGKAYAVAGTISLADMVVSESTGTFSIRARFDNPDRVLLPGMFVRADVSLGVTPNAYLVPQRAVTRSDSGEASAFVVSADSKAEVRTLTTEDSIGNDWIVTGGLSDGDRLIVDGFQKISAGTAVTPVDSKIDADGVIKQVIAATPATAAAADPEVSK